MTGIFSPEVDCLPERVGQVFAAIQALRSGTAAGDADLGKALVGAGALLLLTRARRPEDVAWVLQGYADAWLRRAREDLGVKPGRRETARRIDAAVEAVLNFGQPAQPSNPGDQEL